MSGAVRWHEGLERLSMYFNLMHCYNLRLKINVIFEIDVNGTTLGFLQWSSLSFSSQDPNSERFRIRHAYYYWLFHESCFLPNESHGGENHVLTFSFTTFQINQLVIRCIGHLKIVRLWFVTVIMSMLWAIMFTITVTIGVLRNSSWLVRLAFGAHHCYFL